jgi:hypothetical protein
MGPVEGAVVLGTVTGELAFGAAEVGAGEGWGLA